MDEVHAKHPGCLLDKWKNVLRFALLERSLDWIQSAVCMRWVRT